MRLAALAIASSAAILSAQQQLPQFGGSYTSLDARQQHLIDDWVTRFSATSARKVEPAEFYDQVVRFSTRTTFEAITHALKTTPLTDASGASLGDAIDLIERIDTVRGKVVAAGGDRQFRMYVRLKEDAMARLERSQQFERHADNSVYHKGYPINFRGRGGVPSLQVSISLDRRQADIDVDYRSPSFPAALFNGHLTSSNSDIRAGNNYAKHTGQWSGLQNWWQSFFGIKLPSGADAGEGDRVDPRTPRIGKKPVEAMMKDFLEAWLIEGDTSAAMGYISRRALSCMSEETTSADPGMAPVILARRLKAAHDMVGPHTSLDGLVVGIRLSRPGLRPVKQSLGGQFVLYDVPDDQARAYQCDGDNAGATDDHGSAPKYGKYFGATFYVKTANGPPAPVALLWAQDEGFWRIVAWQTDADDKSETPDAAAPPVAAPAKIATDATLVAAATDFLERWLVRKDYATAFAYLSADAYACYNVVRSPEQPAASSPDDAGSKILSGLQQAGAAIKGSGLESIVSGVPPLHPSVRIMEHRRSRAFTLASLPDALTDASSCASRAGGQKFNGDGPLEYGRGFAAALRFKPAGSDGAVLRLLWMKQDGGWKITAYDIDLP
jgi:hypothetical protein